MGNCENLGLLSLLSAENGGRCTSTTGVFQMISIRISVAIATYNGEEYLLEQLESLLHQKYSPCELVVGDDGSTDSTLEIIQSFAERAPFPVHITQNQHNLGFGDNFLATARRCTGDWIAFCDQDDIWLPNKISECVAAIEAFPDLIQVLQRTELCDGDLKRMGRVFPKRGRAGIHGIGTQFGFWVWPGCLQTVRSDLIHDVDFDSRPRSYFPGHKTQPHDKWTCMIANAIGGICIIDPPVALYRRHHQTLTGSYSGKSNKQKIYEANRTGASHYRFLAEVADDSAKCLERLANTTARTDWKGKISCSAELFKDLSTIQRTRAALYAAPKLNDRLRIYLTIQCRKGYFGQSFIALGFRSAVKDLVRVFLGKQFRADYSE